MDKFEFAEMISKLIAENIGNSYGVECEECDGSINIKVNGKLKFVLNAIEV